MLCVKMLDPITCSNSSSNPGSISTNFGRKNYHLIRLNDTCFLVRTIENRVMAKVFKVLVSRNKNLEN